MTLPAGYGYPSDPADKWRALDHGHAPPLGHAGVLRRVPHDRRPAPRDPGQAVLAVRHPVLARPAVVGAGPRQQGAPPRTRVQDARGGPDRRRRRPPARRRERAHPQPAGLRATARSCPTSRSTRPPTTSSTPSARSCTSPTRRASAGGSRPTGYAFRKGERAEGHRRLRQHAPAHAGDGHQPRLRRAAADGHAGRRVLAPPRPTRSSSAPSSPARASTPPKVDLTLVPRRRGRPRAAHDPRGRRDRARVEDADGDRDRERLRVRHRTNLVVGLGATVRWRFPDNEQHDVTLADGPIGFGSPWLAGRRPLRPALHRARPLPADVLPARAFMSQVVTVSGFAEHGRSD